MHYNDVKLKREQNPAHHHPALPHLHDPGSRFRHSRRTQTQPHLRLSINPGHAAQKILPTQIQNALHCSHLHLGRLRNIGLMALR